jgi:hypothetical protein
MSSFVFSPCSHKNALVRRATARLLKVIVTTSDDLDELGQTAGRKFRDQFVFATASFLHDEDEGTRYCM